MKEEIEAGLDQERPHRFYDLLVGCTAYTVAYWTFFAIVLTKMDANAKVWFIVVASNILNLLCSLGEIADLGRILREDAKMRRAGIKEGAYCGRLIKSGSMGDETLTGDRIELVDGGEYDLFVKYGLGEDGDEDEQQGESHVQQRCQQYG